MKETVFHRFVYSIIRHFITLIAGYLVSRGIVDADLANEFTTEAAMQISFALVAFLATLYFSYKDKVWEFVKTKVAIILPPTVDVERVAEVAATIQNKRAVATDSEPLTVAPTDQGQR
jgi:F0F1-type ATP synthase membrane subunit a